jgi:hypothetical protein
VSSSPNFIALNAKMTDEKLILKNVQGCSRGLNDLAYNLGSYLEELTKARKISTRVVGALVQIRTWHLPNTSQKPQCLSPLPCPDALEKHETRVRNNTIVPVLDMQ